MLVWTDLAVVDLINKLCVHCSFLVHACMRLCLVRPSNYNCYYTYILLYNYIKYCINILM